MGSKNRKRIMIENVRPLVYNGLYPLKKEPGDQVEVTADIFRDGHDKIVARVLWRSGSKWKQTDMECINPGLDLWQSSFKVESLGFYEYKVVAFCDDYGSWAADTAKKVEAVTDYAIDIVEGIEIIKAYKKWLGKSDKKYISSLIKQLESETDPYQRWLMMSQQNVIKLLSENPDPETAVESKTFKVRVDRLKARFASWYECFPRSCGYEHGKSGTFEDVISRLPDIHSMGFDVLYFPPIHPIGFTKRKGPNNSLECSENDPGCPYSIGSNHGGHDAIEPSLGTMDDFLRLVEECKKYDMEIALDFAINCSPDHPYLKEHPEWFKKRPDGSIMYAENPPKKYEDIYPLNFETSDYKGLRAEMLRVLLFWADKGVKIFRVDNPHTKPFKFWEWLIEEVQKKHNDVIFLSEAFTRPKVMKALAKIGFTQSYSYFTWRNEKEELTDYFKELTTPPESDFYRANLFTNTPDIFPTFLQYGGRPAYKIRAVLATTLSTVYGIFQGFELCEGTPIEGREEYLNSDKYEIRVRDWHAPGNIRYLITRLNQLRREYKALQEYDNLEFYKADNDKIMFYGKSYQNEHILVAVNLDPFNSQSAFVDVPVEKFNTGHDQHYEVQDLLTGQRYLWQGVRNYVELNPQVEPAHIFLVKT